MAFENAQLQIWSIRILARLTTLAKDEDQLGILQSTNSLETVLSSFLKCLAAAEKLAQNYKPAGSFSVLPSQPGANMIALPQLLILTQELKNAIYSIVVAYYPYLSYMKFAKEDTAELLKFTQFIR